MQTARRLLAETSMPITEIAFASGFASVRQFNATFVEGYGKPPSALRPALRRPAPPGGRAGPDSAWLTLKLATREPFDGAALLDFLAARGPSPGSSRSPATATRGRSAHRAGPA